MKLVYDLGPALAFFAAYALGGIYVATVTLIAALLLVVIAYRLREKRWNKVHLFAFAVALVLGGVTLALHDPAFIKLKPSLIYGAFALALLGSHLIGERVLMQRMPQKMVVMPEAIWRRVNLAWALFFALCAVLNWYVAAHYDEATWVKLKVFGFTLLMLVFMLAQAPFLARYLVEEKPEPPK